VTPVESSLRYAVEAYPRGVWEDRFNECWTSKRLLAGSQSLESGARRLDLAAPVLWVGSCLYPEVPLLETLVEPLLTLVSPRDWVDNLEVTFAARPEQLWMAPDGLIWTAKELKRRLTLSQRAEEVFVQTLYVDEPRNEFDSISTSDTLFFPVRDDDEAQQAFTEFRRVDERARHATRSTRVRRATDDDYVYCSAEVGAAGRDS
jgi:hypothetical protein